MNIDFSDARVLRQSEVTPALAAAAVDVLHMPDLAVGDGVLLGGDIAARVETHTNGTSTNPAPHPHRGVALYHLGPHAAVPPASPAISPWASGLTHRGELVEGIDVSGFQRGADLSATGRSFVYVKASEGVTLTDVAFQEHWQRAGDAGLLRGAYHFFRSSRSSSDQVGHFVDVVDGVDRGELPPCLDVEVTDGVDLPGVAAAVVRAVETLAALGRRPVVYTMPGFWDTLPGMDHVASMADLWVAHWGVSSPRIPKGFAGAKLWQYSSTATVPGVKGRMDVNRFFGSLEELRTWGQG